MATNFRNYAGQVTSDAEFRTWGSWFSTELAAYGWVQTSDTGQINWTTVTKAAAINTSQGYEIWRMADSLQATVPIYMKLEFGSGAASANSYSFWVTIGKGSDGAGTISNVIWSRRQVGASNANAGTADTYSSGSTDRWQCIVWSNGVASAAATITLSIERSRNSSGTTTGDGIVVICNNGNASGVQLGICYGEYATGDKGLETQLGCLFSRQGTGSSGGAVALYPVFYTAGGGPFKNPLLGAMGAYTGNVTFNGTFTVTVYGASHVYIGCGDANGNTGGTNWVRGTTANRVGLNLLYE